MGMLKNTSPGDYARFTTYLEESYKTELTVTVKDNPLTKYHYLINSAGATTLVAKQEPGKWYVMSLLG